MCKENKNEIVVRYEGALQPSEVKHQVQLIQQVMRDVMKDGTHFATIPGCDKPALLKPGSEKLILTFHLAPKYEEISVIESDDLISYRIRCILTHQQTGITMGEGLGACNSREKKYKTRTINEKKANEDEKSRELTRKEKTGQYGKYTELTILSDPWEIQNTLYKMACKRALVAAVLNATAASDIFTQDIEDDDVTVKGEDNQLKQPQAKQEPQKKQTVEKHSVDSQTIEVGIALDPSDVNTRTRVKELRFRWDPQQKIWKRKVTAKEFDEISKELDIEVL
jgi:hypothetical protein